MNLHEAEAVAQDLYWQLEPACERLQIAGSIRRKKGDVKDIEIVAIPIIQRHQRLNMFGELIAEYFESEIDALVRSSGLDDWGLDPELKRDGSKYKRLQHLNSGICCDLFLTTEAGWGGALAIRTGPGDFSKALVTLALRQNKHVADGYLIHGHPKSPGGCPKGPDCPLIIPTGSEAEFFSALGLPWIEPEYRTEAWVWETAKKGVLS